MKSLYWILAAFVCAIGIWFVWSFRLAKEISIPTVAPEIIQNTSPAPVKGAHWKLDELDYVLRWIPSGSFFMGSPENEIKRNQDEDQRLVTLTKGFWLGQFEVRRKDWQKFVVATGYKSEAELHNQGYGTWVFDEEKTEIVQAQDKNWTNVHAHGDNYPVMAISFNDSLAFCEWITKKERENNRLTMNQRYTLPTEAQWEYACRASEPGMETVFHFGNTMAGKDANFNGQFPYGADKPGLFQQRTMPVGSYMPNNYGLYDMHGNTFEWCLDWYAPYHKIDKKTQSGLIDPVGPELGDKKCYRGGSWFDLSHYCRSAFRGKTPPSDRSDHLGFRLALIDDSVQL